MLLIFSHSKEPMENLEARDDFLLLLHRQPPQVDFKVFFRSSGIQIIQK